MSPAMIDSYLFIYLAWCAWSSILEATHGAGMSSSSIPATQWLVHRTLHLIASLYMHTGLYPESIEPLPQNERHLELTSSDQAENGLWLAYIYSVLWEYDMTPSTVTWEKISRDLDNQGLAVRVSTSSQNMRDYSGHLSLLLLMHDCYYYDPGLSAHRRMAWCVFYSSAALTNPNFEWEIFVLIFDSDHLHVTSY